MLRISRFSNEFLETRQEKDFGNKDLEKGKKQDILNKEIRDQEGNQSIKMYEIEKRTI